MNQHSPRRRVRPAVLAAALGLGLAVATPMAATAAPSTASIVLTTTPSVEVGELVTVEIDLAGAVDVYAAGLTIGFDPALLAFVPDSATGPAGGFDSVDVGTGTVTVLHSRLGGSPPLAGDLAFSLQFEALAAGTGTLVLAVELVDPEGETVTTEDAADAEVAITDDAVGPGDPDGDPDGEPAPAGDDPLATTGVAVGGGILLAAAALAAGLLLVLRRRSAGAS